MSKKSKKSKPKKRYLPVKRVYHSFNDTPYKRRTANTLSKDMSKTATAVLAEYDLPFNGWVTFENIEVQLKKMWKDEDFVRFWLDRMVDEYGYMVWNEVFRKVFTVDYYQNGNLRDAPELSKKLRRNPEAVATHFADAAWDKYRENYK